MNKKTIAIIVLAVLVALIAWLGYTVYKLHQSVVTDHNTIVYLASPDATGVNGFTKETYNSIMTLQELQAKAASTTVAQ